MLSLITELERMHLDPVRPHLARARRVAKGAATGKEAWERLAKEGLVPLGDRLFRATNRELARAGHRPDDLCQINLSHASPSLRALALPYPPTPESAVAYASVEVLELAEQHAVDYLERIAPFRFLLERAPPKGARLPVWRIMGGPVAAPTDGPDLCDVEAAHQLADLARQLTASPPLSHGVTRFFAAHDHATALELWARAEKPIPPLIKLHQRLIHVPQPMIRVRLAQFPNPFEPLVEIWRLGLGIRRLSRETVLLYLPHLASAVRADRTRASSAAEEELRRAVVQADANRAIELLTRGVDPNAEGAHGTALHLAIIAGHRTQAALLSELLESGADPERENAAGLTPLAFAISQDERRLATTLLDLGLDRDGRLPGGRSLLHVAAVNGSARMIDLLIDRGLDPNLRCLRGRTPLHEAALSRALNAPDAMRALLERGSDPNARDRFGWTPLHHAATNSWGGASLANLLIERGARSLRDRGGSLPIDLAVHHGVSIALGRAPLGVATPLDPLPPLPRNADLEEAIHEAPDDDRAWSVYADWLASTGDPRAELIQLDIAANRARGAERSRLSRAIRRTFEDRRVEVLGEIQRAHPSIAVDSTIRSLVFERGFLVRLDHRAAVTTLEPLLTASSACFLRHLSAPGMQSVIRLLEALGSKSLTTLELTSCAAPLEQDLAAALPRVRRLVLHALLPRAIAWPGLAELSFIATGARQEDPVYLDLFLPDLARLKLVARDEVDRPRLLAIARAPLPKLSALSFRGRAELFRDIAHADWFARLSQLELIRAGDEAIARLEQLVAQRQNLQRLRIVAPHLGTPAKRALAKRLSTFVPKVRVS